MTILYTPDFLTIEDDRVVLTECKPRESYSDLAEKNPGRYILEASGELRCPAAEAAAAELGVTFRIWSPSEGDRILAANLKFLADYFREDAPAVPEEAAQRVKAAVMKEQRISIEALKAAPEAVDIDHVYGLVAQGHIFFDLQHSLVSEHRSAFMYPNEEIAKAHRIVRQGLGIQRSFISTLPMHVGAQVAWRGGVYSIANLDSDSVQLVSGQDLVPLNRSVFEQLGKVGEISGIGQQTDATIPREMLEILLSTSEHEFAVANDRWYCYQNPNSPNALRMPRSSWRRLSRRCRMALEALGCAYLGCLPRYHDRGNHSDRLSEPVYEIADRLIKEHYLNLKQKNKRAIHGLIKNESDLRGLVAPSYQWTVDRINHLDKYEVALARKGRRAAYRFTPQLHGQLNPNHGDRPMALVQIDHTQLDIFLVSEDTGEVLEKPWLTLAIDAYSRRVVAFALAFDAPSYRILMLMVRRIVQRQGHMPAFLSVDGGKEFSSCYFEALLARCECTPIKRPPAQARFGAVIERAFGTLNSSFLYSLAGNSQIMKNVRQVTKSVRPEKQAVWSLEALDELLSAFFFDLYDNRPHGELGMSPAQKYASGVELAGAREHRVIVPNEEFLLMTLPTTSKGTAKVIAQRGVLIHGIYFWADEMRAAQAVGSQLPVRYDPYDLGHCYAQLGKRWVKCISGYHGVFNKKTEKEIMVASQMIRQRKRQFGKTKGVTAAKFAEFFLTQVEPEEELRRQRLKDLALSRTSGGCGRGPTVPPSVAESPAYQQPSSHGSQPAETESALSIWPAGPNRTLDEL